MLRTRLLLLLVAGSLVAVLYSLPKIVVENDEGGVTSIQSSSDVETGSTDVDLHFFANISLTDSLKIISWRERVQVDENRENSSIFADSLAELYLSYRSYDSAAKYFDVSAKLKPTPDVWEKAGNAYYESFTFSFDVIKKKEMGEMARLYFGKMLEMDPSLFDLKAKSAMTMVSSDNPMEGIMMLREVVEEDPQNEEALYNLGLLALQTRQWERAISRLEQLVKVNDKHVQGLFYLALCYKELEMWDQAKANFERVKMLDADPEVIATVNTELKEIEQKN